MTEFKIHNVVVCDDVRRENTGKDILVGAYPGSINMGKMPGQVVLSFWLELQFHKNGDITVEIDLKMSSQSIAQFELAIHINDYTVHAAVATPAVLVSIPGDCRLDFLLREKGHKKWIHAKQVPVFHRPNVTVLGLPPTPVVQDKPLRA